MSVMTGIPQFRLRAIESGHLSEIPPELARKYFRCLGIEQWVAQWCRANRELAQRAGLLDRTEGPARHLRTRRRPAGEGAR